MTTRLVITQGETAYPYSLTLLDRFKRVVNTNGAVVTVSMSRLDGTLTVFDNTVVTPESPGVVRFPTWSSTLPTGVYKCRFAVTYFGQDHPQFFPDGSDYIFISVAAP
jgi:hypothetical protein